MKHHKFLLPFALLTIASCGEAEDKQTENLDAEIYQSVELEAPKTTTNYDVEFIQAVSAGDFRVARAMLNQEKATMLSTDLDGKTALMAAAESGHEDIVEMLLERISEGDAVRLDLGDKLGNTALTYATKNLNADIITILREHGANPNVFNKAREFPIHIAVENNDFKSANALAERLSDFPNLNLNAANLDGKTAAHIAVDKNSPAFLRWLKDANANLNKEDINGQTPLSQAISQKKPNLTDLLLSLADVNQINSYGKTVLITAVENENYSAVNKLLHNKADPNIHKRNTPTALQIAVSKQNPNLEIIKSLIAAGAKLESPDMPLGNVLSKAIENGNVEVTELLIASGAKAQSTETQKTSGLLKALQMQNKDLATVLLKDTKDINKTDENGYSPLSLAIKEGYENLAITMVDMGANVNASPQNINASPYEVAFRNNNGRVLTHMLANGLSRNTNQIALRAVTEDKPEILKAALKYSANPNISDTGGQPIIWLAAAKSNISLMETLVEAGANIEMSDNSKQATPLLMSIVTKNKPAFDYLLSQNANVNAQDINGLGAIAYALLTNQPNFIEPLLKSGAKTDIKDSNGNDLAIITEQSALSDYDKSKILELLVQYK